MFEDLLNIYDDFTKNERTQSLSTFAYENEFEFIKREPFGEQSTILRRFDIFPKKGLKRLLGIVHIPSQIEPENEIRFYDFVNTKDLETKTTSIIEFYSPFLTDITLKIKSKKGIANWFGHAKSLEKEFRKNFKVSPPVSLPYNCMEVLLNNKKITIEIRDNVLLAYRKNKNLSLSEILPLVSMIEDFSYHLIETDREDFV